MINFTACARNADYISDDLITSGSIGIPVQVTLSEEFDGLSCVVVFEGSGESIDVALPASGACVVPHEVVAEAGGYLRIGVYARNPDGTIAIPTVRASGRMILPGANPSGVDPAQPTPDWTAQVQQMATNALEMAESVQARADAGEFDGEPGVSPTVTVTPITGGHRVTITDADGARAFDVMDGEDGEAGRGIASATLNADYTLTLTYTDGTTYTTPSLRGEPGEDGYSPTAFVRKTGKTATITITDKQGTTTAAVNDGEDGAPGVSPTVTVTDITGGHRVTITDADGTHSFDVMDGGVSMSEFDALKSYVLDMSPTAEASGAIVSVDDAAPLNAEGLVVQIVPVQGGSGIPSPDNVRPITGWTGANVMLSPTLDAVDGSIHSVNFPSGAGVVYGGYLDLVNGKLVIDMAETTFSAANIDSATAYTYQNKSGVQLTALPFSMSRANGLSSHSTIRTGAYTSPQYMWLGSSNGNRVVYWIGILDALEVTLDQWKVWAKTQQLQIVYELATPITYTIDPVTLALMRGVNNVWADTGDTALTYRQDVAILLSNISGT